MTYPYRHIAVLSHCARCRKRLPHRVRVFCGVRRDSDAGGNESVTVLTVGWAEARSTQLFSWEWRDGSFKVTVGWASAHQSTSKNEETVG